MRPRHHAGFTLVEMLVVLTIMSILTSLVVIGVGGNRGAKLSADGNAVADLVGLAQQNAIGKNAPTALVFAQTTDGAQAFSIYQLNTSVDPISGATTSTWTQVTMWKFLSNGVAMDAANSTFPTVAGSSPSVTPPLAISTISGRTVQEYGYEVFLPGCQIVNSDNVPPKIHLVEGVVQDGTLTSNAAGAPNFYNVLINPVTARPIVERP